MPKKNKTLPKNFDELIKKKDLKNLKKVFGSSELDATGGYAKGTAFNFSNIPNEFVTWLFEQGANLEAMDIYSRTALINHAMSRNADLTIFLKLGANVNAIDKNKNTALHFAAGSGFNISSVKNLLKYGANANFLNSNNETPVEYALSRANNIDIVDLVEISKIFLKDNKNISQKMKDSVESIGKNFEFHRENFNKADVKQTDKALSQLYKLFGITPVKKRITHDGISLIKVKAKTWQKQFEELWEFLILSNGSAKTVQGELVRIAGKVRDEIYRNGGGNWDSDFKKMLDTFLIFISEDNFLKPDELKKLELIIKEIRKNGDGEDKDFNYLCELAVKFVLKNPKPILLKKVNYDR